jgi:hypothetical protein
VRYHKEIELLPMAARSKNGYRVHTQADIERLRFIQRAKVLDFSIAVIREIYPYVISLIRPKTVDSFGVMTALSGRQTYYKGKTQPPHLITYSTSLTGGDLCL